MVKDNVEIIRARIAAACSRVNRDPKSITLVAVSKGRGIEQIKEAIEAGITDIGENKIQEAMVKYDALRTMNYELRTHMVGHLQTNKARQAVKMFDLIQSVDSGRLANEINKEASRINKIQDVLIEVKTSPEATKFGVVPEQTASLVKEIVKLKNVNIKGLMTIAPLVDNPEKARPYFRILRELKDEIDPGLNVLSMGMTDDFEVAIEEGSNMVRLGRAIFES